MFLRSTLITPEEAGRYVVRSVSRTERRSGLYFATLRAPNLPSLMLRVEYRTGVTDKKLYPIVTVKEDDNKISPVCYDTTSILAKKVLGIIEEFEDLDYDSIKRCEDEQKARPAG